jgi:hypothetical protein
MECALHPLCGQAGLSALIVPPFPAPSRPSKTIQIFMLLAFFKPLTQVQEVFNASSRSDLIAPLLHATVVGGSSSRRFCPAILTTILTLPRSAYNRTCHRRILGLVLSIFLFNIVVYLVIKLVMLTTACSGNRRTGYRASSGTTGTST